MAQNRRFIRLRSNLIVKIRRRRPTEQESQAVESRITNISMGGVFIETPDPFEVGTFVELDFTIPRHGDRVHARGTVRWVGRAEGGAMGMGIEFLEVTVPTRAALGGYLEQRMRAEGMAALTSTRLRQDLLRLHARKVGQTLSLEVLSRFFAGPHEEIIEALGALEQFGLVRTAKDQVTFDRCPEESMRLAVEEWVAANPAPPEGA